MQKCIGVFDYQVLMECESMLWFMLERKTHAYQVGISARADALARRDLHFSMFCGFHFYVHSLLVEDSKLSQADSSAFKRHVNSASTAHIWG
jgi:hypothetical protein